MKPDITEVITDYDVLTKGYVVREGFIFTAMSEQTNVFDTIVIINSLNPGSWGSQYGQPLQSLERHIEFINEHKLEKAKILADSIEFLRECPSLSELQIIPTIQCDDFDFSPLYNLKRIRTINCITNYGDIGQFVSEVDYSKINGIEELYVSGKGHFNYCKKSGLNKLWISQNKENIDLRDIGNCERLSELTLMQCSVKSLHGIGKINGLEKIYMSNNRLLEDISEIQTQAGTLKSLAIDNCHKIIDFTCLYNLNNLEHLQLYGNNNLSDLYFLSQMPNLKTFCFTMDVKDGDLSICRQVPYVYCGRGRKHYNLKDKDLPKNL